MTVRARSSRQCEGVLAEMLPGGQADVRPALKDLYVRRNSPAEAGGYPRSEGGRWRRR